MTKNNTCGHRLKSIGGGVTGHYETDYWLIVVVEGECVRCCES